MRRLLAAFVAISALAFAPRAARADGFVVIERPPRPVPSQPNEPFPLGVKAHNVTVTIKGQVAVTQVDQIFSNPLPYELEGTYVFPLPEDAAVDKFSMWIDGKETEAELLDKDKAREIYEGIVRSMRDPALVEYMGRGMFKARIYPIPASGEKRVKISYAQVLKQDGGLCRYRYPLGTEKHSATPLEKASILVTMEEDRPIKAIYAPWQDLDVRRDGDRKVKASWEASRVRVDKDFLLVFGLEESEIGMTSVSYGTRPGDPDDSGTFLLFITPKTELSEKDVMPKDVIFVFDTSGSMLDDGKMEQARRALRYCVQRLDARDRFGIIDFSTDVRSFRNELVAASEENVKSALEYVASLKAKGGTALEESLLAALKMRTSDEKRPFQVVFLTDGEPTIGTTVPDQIVEHVTKALEGKGARVFVFGVGAEVNAPLLDKLAENGHGTREYVLPGEDIEVAMSSFYEKVASPVMSDLELTIDGVRCADMYPSPRRLPDLFKGNQISIAGRFAGEGTAKLTLKGKVNGETRTLVQQVQFKKDAQNGFLPRIWAQRKIGFLLDEIRLHGEKAETKQEVVQLARAYGIPTPYTSWLVVDESELRRRRQPTAPGAPAEDAAGHAFDRLRREAQEKGRGNRADAPAPATAAKPDEYATGGSIAKKEAVGESASRDAKRVQALEGADKDSDAALARAAGIDAETIKKAIQQVGAKTFYFAGSAWVDSTVDAPAREKAKKVAYLSGEYFDLLKAHPEASSFFALGAQIVVRLEDGSVVEVTKS